MDSVNNHCVSPGWFSNRLYLHNYQIPTDFSGVEQKYKGIRSYSALVGYVLSIIGYAQKIHFENKNNESFYVNRNSLAQWEFRKISSFLDGKKVILQRISYNDYKKNGYNPKIIEIIKKQFVGINNKNVLTITELKESERLIDSIVSAYDEVDATPIQQQSFLTLLCLFIPDSALYKKTRISSISSDFSIIRNLINGYIREKK